MNTYSYLQRGLSHPDFCEDFLFEKQLGQRFRIAAVMDGCSMGKDSHFASSLQAKILGKICQILPYQVELEDDKLSLELFAKEIFRRFFLEMKRAKNDLLLDTTEMLATCIAMIWDAREEEALLFAAGDGCWAVDSDIIYHDQDNRPDYPAYHIGKRFEAWYEAQPQKIVKQPELLAIATDGVSSYIGKGDFKPLEGEVEQYILQSNAFAAHENMLHRKATYLRKQKGWEPLDDIAVVCWRQNTN